jgi:hypothetical protein
MSYYQVSVFLKVTDEDKLLEAALDHLFRCGIEGNDANETLRPNNVIDVSACLRMLIDPGNGIDGVEVDDTCAEETFTSAMEANEQEKKT